MIVLILGGYGTFGGRLCQLLADEPRLSLLVAGRSIARATSFCGQLPGRARRYPVCFDREGDVLTALRGLAPDLVVDASGPFQEYGDEPYRVVAACVSLGISYLDLADGADFVEGVREFDAAARERGIFVLSGVSSFPVLTAAVVRLLAGEMKSVESVVGGIAPSPYAGVGMNVLRAIASYAGKPVGMLKDGSAFAGYAFCDFRYFTIAVPGRLPLRPIRFSLVDVPDLRALSTLWPELQSVWMGAGPVPESLHRALNLLAGTVRLGLLRSLTPFAGLMHRVTRTLRWGEHRGGMFVQVSGRDAAGELVERSWHLLAEGDDGPLIPSMAAEAVIRRVLDGPPVSPGARPALGELEVRDYEALFSRRQIYTGIRNQLPATSPLYERLLGTAWGLLPPAVREMHDRSGAGTASGLATVETGTGMLARLLARLFGFPAAGRDVPVKVTFAVRDGRETWLRDFAGRRFSSVQEAGRGRFDGLLCERFGPLAFGLALVADGGQLRLLTRAWSLFGVPLPLAFAPGGLAFEAEVAGRFSFHVEIRHPWTGLIVAYRGWLTRPAR